MKMKGALFFIPLETLFLTGLIIGVLVLSSLAQADLSFDLASVAHRAKEAASAKGDDFTLSGYTEADKRSTAEDYEEEGTDDDYAYQKYHLKLEQKLSERLSYDISSFIYEKDYESGDSLDNISRIFKLNSSYFLRKLKEESFGEDYFYKKQENYVKK